MSDVPLTISDAAAALRSGELSSVELTRAVLERADDAGQPCPPVPTPATTQPAGS